MQIDGDLVSINEKLREYEAAWDAWVDAWLVVKVGAPDWVYKWRLQAEHAMLAAGKPGMSDEQVRSSHCITASQHTFYFLPNCLGDLPF